MSGKRELILDAALKLFIEKGFQNTSTANISKEAGVATGTLFLYFANKDILINELYKECKKQMGCILKDNFRTDGNTKDKLYHLWTNACEWACDNNEAFRFINMFKFSPLISGLTREELSASIDFGIHFFQQSMERGELKKMDIAMLLSVIDGLMSATVTYITANPEKERKDIIHNAFSIFWSGVENKKL